LWLLLSAPMCGAGPPDFALPYCRQAVSTCMSAEQDGGADALYSKGPSVVSETLDGELVLLCLDSGVYYGLDAIGTLIWTSLNRGSSVQQTLDLLDAHFPDTPREQLQRDMRALITQLSEAKLLVAAQTQQSRQSVGRTR